VPLVARNGTCADETLQISHALVYADRARRWSLIAELTNRTADSVQTALLCLTIRNPAGGMPIYEEWFAGMALEGYETIPVRVLLQATDIHSDTEISVFARTDQTQAARADRASTGDKQLVAGTKAATLLATSDDARSFSVSAVTLHGVAPGPLTVQGELHNSGTQAVSNVHLVFALRGSDDGLVGVADAQVTELEPLGAGQAVSFTATTNMALAPVARYTWLAKGDVAEAP